MDNEKLEKLELPIVPIQDIWYDNNNAISPKPIEHHKYWTDKDGPGKHFQIGKCLGTGNFGTVHQATNTKNDQEYAIKIVEKPPSSKPNRSAVMLKVTEREISLLRVCNHPNIIELLQVIETPKIVYMVLELCDQSLADILSLFHSLSEDETRRVVHPVSEALAYLHANEIAHRDLKLSNILCKTDPEDKEDFFWKVKLSDFGLAACRGAPGTTELFRCPCGTPIFMAPEVLQKDPYDQKCDTFSLGVIMFYCLVGEEPFPGKSEEEVRRRHAASKVTLQSPEWSIFSSAVRFIVKKLLLYDPLSRYSALQVFSHPWTKGTKDIPESSLQPRRRHLMPKSSIKVILDAKECIDALSKSKNS